MRKRLVVMILFLSSFAIGQEASLQFEEANQFYRGGKYQQAAQLYEQIEHNGYGSSSLYYNLGNAYFKLHNFPAALLSYERAKRLSPHDEDISYNLRLANLRVIDKIEPLPRLFFIEWWQSFMDLLPSDGWAVAGIVALWIAACCGVLFFIFHTIALQRI